MRARLMEPLLEMAHRVNRIENFAPGVVRAGFDERWQESRMIGTGDGNHGIAIGIACHLAMVLVRRTPCGNEMDFVQMESALGSSRYGEMSDVNWIERAAEDGNPPFVRAPPRRIVALRRRHAQLASGDAEFSNAAAEAPAVPSNGSAGASRSSASAMARTSCGMPSP